MAHILLVVLIRAQLRKSGVMIRSTRFAAPSVRASASYHIVLEASVSEPCRDLRVLGDLRVPSAGGCISPRRNPFFRDFIWFFVFSVVSLHQISNTSPNEPFFTHFHSFNRGSLGRCCRQHTCHSPHQRHPLPNRPRFRWQRWRLAPTSHNRQHSRRLPQRNPR